MTIEELIGKCKGKQGDDETESILIDGCRCFKDSFSVSELYYIVQRSRRWS